MCISVFDCAVPIVFCSVRSVDDDLPRLQRLPSLRASPVCRSLPGGTKEEHLALDGTPPHGHGLISSVDNDGRGYNISRWSHYLLDLPWDLLEPAE